MGVCAWQYNAQKQPLWTRGVHKVNLGAPERNDMQLRMMFLCVSVSVGLAFCTVVAAAGESAPQRTFEFTYAGKVVELPPGKAARIWLPVPSSSAAQKIEVLEVKLPGKETFSHDAEYGNEILYVEGTANSEGIIPFEVRYKVTRREVRTDARGNVTFAPAEKNEQLARFLQPDAKVPVGGKPLELLKDRRLPADSLQTAKVLYDVVNSHMKYSKEGKGWGQGDAVWACDSKFGNCSDFHSLFISMARGSKIPAKFEMGFPIPEKRGEGTVAGYHCWAWFMPAGKGWIPVDISEGNRHPEKSEYYFGNLTADRVQFTTGRDITLEPRQAGPALNFFVYPYAEVDGQPYPADKVQRAFSYRDL